MLSGLIGSCAKIQPIAEPINSLRFAGTDGTGIRRSMRTGVGRRRRKGGRSREKGQWVSRQRILNTWSRSSRAGSTSRVSRWPQATATRRPACDSWAPEAAMPSAQAACNVADAVAVCLCPRPLPRAYGLPCPCPCRCPCPRLDRGLLPFAVSLYPWAHADGAGSLSWIGRNKALPGLQFLGYDSLPESRNDYTLPGRRHGFWRMDTG